MKTFTLAIEGMTCGHCVASVRTALSTVSGAQLTKLTPGSATLNVPEVGGEALAATAAAAVTEAAYPARVAP